MSKHEDIIAHILSLPVGTKISVRSIALELGVSDGTAYRAIKDCDNFGIVTTIPRVGTVRIDKVEKKNIETLTFAEVVNIVDGSILGGKGGIYKALNKFVIGAMKVDAIEKYISPGCLLIVGNREAAQKLALEKQSAVLITGGFGCSEEIKKLANEKDLPIISSSYDTFTIASMINKALSENLIKKEIILVEDIMATKVDYLYFHDKISKWKQLMAETGHERYPVVDEDMKVVGIISPKDMSKAVDDQEYISKIMSKEPTTVTPKTTVAYAAHIMGWEGFDICPVVEGKRLVGVISNQDVIKALQYIARQPQAGETMEDLILKNFQSENRDNKMYFNGSIIPEMLDPIGTASWSSLNMLLTTMAVMTLRQKNIINLLVDSVSTYFMKPVQIDSKIEITSEIIDMGRNFCKVEVTMFNRKRELIAKAIMSSKLLKD